MFKNIAKKFALLVASAAMAIALVPAMAFADSSTDQTIEVDWTATDGTECTATVDLTSLAESGTYGTLYYKAGAWNVIGTNSSVALSTVFQNAEYTNTDGDVYTASSVWSDGKTLTLYTDDSTTAYNKWTSFTYENLNPERPFYEDTTSSTLVTTATASYSARLALDFGSQTIATTAGNDLSTMSFSNTSVRLMWGYLDANNQGGNRFPYGITKIVIS